MCVLKTSDPPKKHQLGTLDIAGLWTTKNIQATGDSTYHAPGSEDSRGIWSEGGTFVGLVGWVATTKIHF